jgi:import receptor subunit TOM22
MSTYAGSFAQFLDRPGPKKARRIAFHVFRGANKFLQGSGRAAWVMGTTALLLVVPLIFEIDREQQVTEMEAMQLGGAPQGLQAPPQGLVMPPSSGR